MSMRAFSGVQFDRRLTTSLRSQGMMMPDGRLMFHRDEESTSPGRILEVLDKEVVKDGKVVDNIHLRIIDGGFLGKMELISSDKKPQLRLRRHRTTKNVRGKKSKQ